MQHNKRIVRDRFTDSLRSEWPHMQTLGILSHETPFYSPTMEEPRYPEFNKESIGGLL